MATRPASQRRFLLFAALPALLVILCFAFRVPVASALGAFLVVRDPLESADVIFLLNGDPNVRPQQAADLLKKGLAPQIAIARQTDSPGVEAGAYPNPTDTNIFMLKKCGVPEEKIRQLKPPGGVSHTFDEAVALREYYRERGFSKVIVVTSDMHSRRARFIFRRVFSGTGVHIALAPVADLKYGAADWWKTEDGIVGCENEYIKLVYYHLRY